MINFSGVATEPTNKKLQFVGFGLNDNVVVTDVESQLNTNGKPFIRVKFKYADDATDNSTSINLYMTDAASPKSMEKIMHLHQAINKLVGIQSKTYENLEAMALDLKTMWANKPFRLKLQAAEYLGVDQAGKPKIKIRLGMGLPPFAESMNPYSEMTAIMEQTASALKFDKGNRYDYEQYKPKPGDPVMTGSVQGVSDANSITTPKDDLPF